MRMSIFLITFFPLLSWSLEAHLVGLPKRDLTISVKGVTVPREALKGHLKSGLHSRFVFELAAIQGKTVFIKTSQNWKIYYDLWDEVYRVTVQEDGKKDSKIEFKTLEDFFIALENPSFENIHLNEQFQTLPKEGTLGIRIVMNPVSQETVERVKKMVHQRRVPALSGAPSSAGRAGGPAGETAPRFPALFNEILGYEMSDAKQNSAWNFEAAMPFTLKEQK